jgi:putative flippase GtrA
VPAELKGKRLREFLSFAAVGVLAFIVDAGVLSLAVWSGSGPHFGRVLSYLCAVTVSWECNRRFTFSATRTRASLSSWARFAVAQLGGAAVNLGTYFLLIELSPTVARNPVIGVAAGSVAGLAINFTSARLVVFRGKPASQP